MKDTWLKSALTLAKSWTGVVIGIWWITAFVGLSDCK